MELNKKQDYQRRIRGEREGGRKGGGGGGVSSFFEMFPEICKQNPTEAMSVGGSYGLVNRNFLEPTRTTPKRDRLITVFIPPIYDLSFVCSSCSSKLSR